jgi:lysophospholipase L1-like esterase
VAIGDSFTEGLMDAPRDDGRHRGWADRLAQNLADLAAREGAPGIEYANLAVRGRLLPQVVTEQVPAAVALAPDLVSFAAGVNDCLRRDFDVQDLASRLDDAVSRLTANGAHVLLFAYGDPSRRSRVLGRIRDRILDLNRATESVAERFGCSVVRYWDAAVMDDDRLWDEDRLHLSPQGHAVAAVSAAEALGFGSSEWRTPLVPGPRPSRAARISADLGWARAHALPWVGRRLRRRSSGDVVTAKNATWTLVEGYVAPGHPQG